jgi:hypothetical protein
VNWKQLGGTTLKELLEKTSAAREGGIFKFAKVNGEYRFIQLHWHENHGMLVDEGETATTAGTITLNNDFWRLTDMGSSTLKVGFTAETEDELKELLVGREFKSRWS